MILRTALLSFIVTTGPASAEVVSVRYVCERGVEIPATYAGGAEGEDRIAVITAEGRQVTLFLEPSGSGSRYGWPSDGSGYVWWIKGDEASLFWRDGASGSETPVYSECRVTG